MAAIEDAVHAIGHQQGDDWILAPEAHGQSLPSEAGALARVLARPEVGALMEDYRAADSTANSAQKRYKTLGRMAIVFYAAAVILGGLHLLPLEAVYDWLAARAALPVSFEDLKTASATLIFVLILTAIVSSHALLRLKPFERWNTARAKAEITRIELFEKVIAAEEPARAGELALLPLQLEYFRRYQLHVQRAYYAGRGAQHEAADRARATRRNYYTMLASFAAAPATWGFFELFDVVGQEGGFLAGHLNESFIFAGLVASSLIMAQNSLSLLSQDRRNATRYKSVSDNLIYLEMEYLPAARAAAAAGDRAGVFEFVAAVNDQISSEHREWISLQEQDERPDFETIASTSLPRLPRRRR